MSRPSLKQLTIQFIGRILGGRSVRWSNNGFFSDNLGGVDSDAGITITNDRALNYTAYWSCVTLLAGTIASLPCHLKQQKGERNTINAREHSLYTKLHDAPNPEMDSFSYFETMMYHLCAANGNFYSFIDLDESRTEVEALWIMDPERTSKFRLDNGDIAFRYQSEKAGQIILPAYRVWHIPGFGYDGLHGYTPLTYARNLIGNALGTEKMGAALFRNGLTFGGFLEHPGQMSQPAQDRWEKRVKDKHEGVENAHRVLILEEGMKYNKNNITPQDAQMLDTQKHLYTRMAGFFHVPPHMIGDLEHATFSNIEEQNIYYGVHSIRPWCVRIERSGNRQLLLDTEKADYFIKFQMDALLRGNTESRYRSYAIGRNWGWMSANDVLELEDRNSIGPAGDVYMAPSNMMPADQFNDSLPKPADTPPQPQPK
jgi:HK97 family phage portal protein